MAVIVDSRNDTILHRYKNLGAIRRYVTRAKRDSMTKPYMVSLYKNFDDSGYLTIGFMGHRNASCEFTSYEVMVEVVKRWRNLRDCEVSEFYEIPVDMVGASKATLHRVWRLERIWKRGE